MISFHLLTLYSKDPSLTDDDDDEDNDEDDLDRRSNSVGKRLRGRVLATPIPPLINSKWLKMCMAGKEKLLPSAKMVALKSQILQWLAEAPKDKILSRSNGRSLFMALI
jgi:hypothetical protein